EGQSRPFGLRDGNMRGHAAIRKGRAPRLLSGLGGPLQAAIGRFFADNCTQMAAAISYYVLFSLFPLVIFLVAVLVLFLRHRGLQEKTVDAVLDYIPLSEDRGRNEVGEAVRNIGGASSAGLGAFGLIVMMWQGRR